MTPHKVKDNSLKSILSHPQLFLEFMQKFIHIDRLKNISLEDIEDISERFLPLFDENRDADTIKKIRIGNELPFYVVTLVEYESKVNFRSPFKLLLYMSLIWEDYEKETNAKDKGATFRKDFKYPPIVPVVFYDGPDKWTASMNFKERVAMPDTFGKYIPGFEYELISLNDYPLSELLESDDTLSLIMFIDRLRGPNGLKALKDLPVEYLNRLAAIMPDNLKKVVGDAVWALLENLHVPRKEIAEVVDKIDKRELSEMFTWIEGYDVQETRRTARMEGEKWGKALGLKEGKERGKALGFKEGEKRGKSHGLKEGEHKKQLEIAKNMKTMGVEIKIIAKATKLSIADIDAL